MNNITFTIQVNLGVNPELYNLVKPLVDHLLVSPTPAPVADQEQKPTEAEPKPAEVERKPAKTERKAAKPAKVEKPLSTDPAPLSTEAEVENPPLSTDPEPAPTAEPAPVAEDPAPTVAQEYTEEDVRAAMHRTRQRIEGEDYKGKPDSEGYKQWHRVLTAWFKNTAAIYGVEKPSALPDSESRAKFIRDCDEVSIINGELSEPVPF